MLDSLIKVIWFLGNALLCWFLIYLSAPYNPNKPNAKYITIKNKTIANLLIPKRNPWLKYVKVKDRNKLRLPSLIGYISLTLLLLASLVMFLLPSLPCEPVALPFSRRSQITVATYNEKIPLSLILVFLSFVLLSFIIPAFIHSFSKKAKPIDIGSQILIFFVILLFLFMSGYLLINLI